MSNNKPSPKSQDLNIYEQTAPDAATVIARCIPGGNIIKLIKLEPQDTTPAFDAAVAYANFHRWKNFPARMEGGKKYSWLSSQYAPGHENWGMTDDYEQLRKNFNNPRWRLKCGVGVPTGTINGIFVVENDTVVGHGVDGLKELKALEREHGKLPLTLMARTPSGSIHRYFKHPGGRLKSCGSPEATRRAFNKRFLVDLAEDWQQHGREVFKRVRRESPASYLKVCAMLVPKELQVEHSGGVKAMTDEQLERSIELLKEMIAKRDAGANAKVIEATAESVALPAPNGPSPEAALEATLEPTKRKPNRLMEADTAVGPKERKPRQRKMPPPASA
jgi:hypothetical protein